MVGSGSDCYCSYVHCKDDFDGLRLLTDIGMESSEMIMVIVLGALHSELCASMHCLTSSRQSISARAKSEELKSEHCAA
ncbi:putative cyclin d [Corchorus olitorius]|uniref:Cyclin d n=1 Tax=Corchorus olitorius TaxID=93759 RepID=A0A1R3KU28_9ROSI|nr:putative cyclin d [Corchorus olitorius]